jgi:chorismate mutase
MDQKQKPPVKARLPSSKLKQIISKFKDAPNNNQKSNGMLNLQSIMQNIRNIPDFNSTIERINKLDILIIDKIAELKPYYADYSIFNSSHAELSSKGVDVVWKDVAYWPILLKFLKPGKNEDNASFFEKYVQFQDLAYERVMIGQNVINYKSPRNLEIERPQREKEILDRVSKYAESKGLDPEKMRESFNHIMALNKNVQRCHAFSKSFLVLEDPLRVVRSVSTQCIHVLDFIEPRDAEKARSEGRSLNPEKDRFTMMGLNYEADALTQKTGIKHFLRSKAEKGSYVVEIAGEYPSDAK